jgi:DMSO/TMAO reductase YedYZ molybdopterin-dependent catalytic subunit
LGSSGRYRLNRIAPAEMLTDLRVPVSTALWTGVYLADVLEYVKPKRGRAKHVVFEGIDNLPKGPYGTSQLLSWAANKDRGMLIGKQLYDRHVS